MILASEINISLSYSPIILIAGIIISILFSIWIYRVTLPNISLIPKIVLTAIRSLALALILAAIFEPVLSFINKEDIEPTTLLFTDNSSSMKNFSSNDSLNIVNSISDLSEKIIGNLELFSFGKIIGKMDEDEIQDISFNDSLTNISELYNIISDKKNDVSSVIIVSDGNFNSGSDPSNELSKLGIPVFTIGVGDTIIQIDLEIRDVLYNKFLYVGTDSEIKSIILNNGFNGEKIKASLKENNSVIDSKEIMLSENGINFVNFIYKPETSGEKKLTLEISQLNKEASFSNNKKSFFIDVIDNKLNLAIISAAPSVDAKFIFNSLKEDENLKISQSIQINENKFLSDFNNEKIKDAEILYLIGFPGKESPQNLINIVKQKLAEKTPFLIVVNENTDLQKLKIFDEFLPFSINQIRDVFTKAFVNVNDFNSPLLGNSLEERNLWNDLPPILRNGSGFNSKSGSNVIAKMKIGNTQINEPLILSSNIADNKSIAILAGEIWKWKLNDKGNSDLVFDNFFNTSVKWLRDESNKNKFIISSDKKIYSTSESVFLKAELYDEALNPLSNAEIQAEIISSENESIPFRFNYSSNGLYEYSFDNLASGNYKIKAKASLNNSNYAETNFNFSIEKGNIEKNTTTMNYEFLNNLASVSNGKFYYLKETNNTLKSVNEINKLFNRQVIEKNEFRFWSNEIILMMIILLFSIEWFVRKRLGMI